MKPTKEDIKKALMLFVFGNLNPDCPTASIDDIDDEARSIHNRWDDEPDLNVCYNHSCPNNAFDWEDQTGSHCINNSCEYGAQLRTPKEDKQENVFVKSPTKEEAEAFIQKAIKETDIFDDVIEQCYYVNGMKKVFSTFFGIDFKKKEE